MLFTYSPIYNNWKRNTVIRDKSRDSMFSPLTYQNYILVIQIYIEDCRSVALHLLLSFSTFIHVKRFIYKRLNGLFFFGGVLYYPNYLDYCFKKVVLIISVNFIESVFNLNDIYYEKRKWYKKMTLCKNPIFYFLFNFLF